MVACFIQHTCYEIKIGMNQLEFFALVIESCLVECTVELSFNWSYEEFEKNSKLGSRVSKTFPYLAGSGWIFRVTKDNKASFIEAFCSSFTASDFYLFMIKHDDKEIGKCFDSADANFLNPIYFDRILLASKLDDVDIVITYSED